MLDIVSTAPPEEESAVAFLLKQLPRPVLDAYRVQIWSEVHDELLEAFESEKEERYDAGYRAGLRDARDEGARLLADLEEESEDQRRQDRAAARRQAREAVEEDLATLGEALQQAETREGELIYALTQVLDLLVPLGRSVNLARALAVLRTTPSRPLDLDRLNQVGARLGWQIEGREASGTLAVPCLLEGEEDHFTRVRREACPVAEAPAPPAPLALPVGNAPEGREQPVLAE